MNMIVSALTGTAVSASVSPTTLAGLAAPTLVAEPAAVATSPDTDLLMMIEEWFATKEATRQLANALAPYEDAWFDRRNKLEAQIPDALRVRPDDVEIGIPDLWTDGGVYSIRRVGDLMDERWLHTVGIVEAEKTTISQWRETPSPEARARADEIIKAWARWQKKINRKPPGYRIAERKFEAAAKRNSDLWNGIMRTPARSPSGLVGKARVIEAEESPEAAERALRCFAHDLLALNS